MTERCPVCQSPVRPGEGQCAVCGFKLVGTTRGFDPLADGRPVTAPVSSGGDARLRMIRGAQVGAEYPIEGELMTIGRNPSCSIFLNDMTVSREHATISKETGAYVLRDQQSFNGVWVNNRNVEAKALADGDVVQIGAFAFVYEDGRR